MSAACDACKREIGPGELVVPVYDVGADGLYSRRVGTACRDCVARLYGADEAEAAQMLAEAR